VTEFQVDEIGIHSDMDKPVRVKVNVTAARVEHYGDVVEVMARGAIERYTKKHGSQPSDSQIDHLKADLVRALVIQRDVLGAQSLEIT